MANIGAVPLPITDATRWGRQHQRYTEGRAVSEPSDQLDERGREMLGAAFPKRHDPATALPFGVARYLWLPTYYDFRRRLHLDGNADELDGGLPAVYTPGGELEIEEIERRLTVETLDRRIKEFEFGGTPDNLPDQTRRLATRIATHDTRMDRFRSARETFFNRYLGARPSCEQHLRRRLDDAWNGVLKAIPVRFTSEQSNELNQWIRSNGSAYTERLPTWVTQLKEASKATEPQAAQCLELLRRTYALAAQLEKEALEWETRLKLFMSAPTGGDRPDFPRPVSAGTTDNVLQLVANCQEIDASLRVFAPRAASAGDDGATVSSTGIELGPAENWLHRLMIWREAIQIRSLIQAEGSIPIWRLFLSDFLGTTSKWDRTNAAPADDVDRRLRVCTVSVDGSAPHRGMTSELDMQERGISPEFLIVGTTRKTGEVSMDDVQFHALVSTVMSEPFHTCRIMFRFAGEELDEHVKWLKEIWENKAATDQLLHTLRLTARDHHRHAARKATT
jgi:hypothetical protein